jgi:DNA-binding transcriptional MocR family regulator
MSSIGSARQEIGQERLAPSGSIPSQRNAADAYRVSDEQLQAARLVVARNSADSEDLRQLLDMLGLISGNPDLPPPVTR